jgi:hypothetical protein
VFSSQLLDDNWISSRPSESDGFSIQTVRWQLDFISTIGGGIGWERVTMRSPRLDLCRWILTGIGEVGRCIHVWLVHKWVMTGYPMDGVLVGVLCHGIPFHIQ